MELNPNFDFSGLSLDDITQETAKIENTFAEAERKDKNPFPVEAFPKAIQEIIKATNESLNFPIDFAGVAILYAVSLAVGNTYRLEVMKGWYESTLLYIAIVGRAGTNKSHPLSWFLQIFFDKDTQSYKEYEQKRQEYQYAVNLTKKDREQQFIEEPVKPVWQKYIVQDFTPEALTEVHKFMKRRIGVVVDELASWFKNFNRYNKGSEQETWLSIFSNKPLISDRKSGEPTFIPLPYIPVIGTIQNAVLEELAKDSRSQNGFIDRILFAMPNDLKKLYWSEKELNPIYKEKWHVIINNLIEIPLQLDDTGTPLPTVIKFTPAAKSILKSWVIKNTDLCNTAPNEAIAGIYSKLEIYVVRLSLILQMLRYGASEADKQAVEVEAVNGAILLIEYFRNTALKVHSTVSNSNPLDKLPTDKQKLYEALPDAFTTETGLQIAKRLEVSERTYKRFLNDKELFEKIRTGEYEKRL